MLRRPLTRFASAAAIAGTACALGASAAFAAPAATWSGPSKPVPGALTNDSPALAAISFPNPIGQGQAVAWRGRGIAGHIFYKYRTVATHRWSHFGELTGALTGSAPALGSYTDPLGRHALLMAWTGHLDKHIWYSQGETRPDGTIGWTAPVALPTFIKFSKSFAGPAVFFPDHKDVVMIAWRGPANHVRYTIGVPLGRGFRWQQSAVVPGTPPSPTSVHCTIAPCTSDTLAVTEQTTSTSSGQIFVFWKQLGTKDIFSSTATDDHSPDWSHLTWTAPAQVPGAVTLTAPAASVPTLNAIGPLLLVYKAAFSTHVRFQTLTGTTWSGPAIIPTARTAVAPALLRNVLATTTPATIGNIVFHVYR